MKLKKYEAESINKIHDPCIFISQIVRLKMLKFVVILDKISKRIRRKFSGLGIPQLTISPKHARNMCLHMAIALNKIKKKEFEW